MDRYGLIGYPLGHSFSQKYFTEKFDRESIDARYDLFPLTKIEEVEQLIDNTPGLRGFNVTIPYKQQIIKYLDGMDEEAKAIGAVNVVAVRHAADGRAILTGHNSDIYGFTESIRPLLKETDKKALVLGSGGASKAVTYSLKKLGVDTVVVSRHPTAGQMAYADIDAAVLKDYTVVVNASPVGMFPCADECPDIPYNLLTDRHVCFDLVYNPEETLFLKRAAERGASVKNGLEMLHLQAEGAWKMWQQD